MTEARPRPLDPVPESGEPRVDALHRLVAIVDRLRDPEDGCPWDLEQTVESMAPSLIEEAHEALEAIEAGGDTAASGEGAAEELGDLLMGIVLIARIAEQEERFDLARVANAVGDKLVRRHPHVFGDVEVDGAEHALVNWERIKQAERAKKRADTSALAGVPTAMPALQRADRLNQKAIAAGFRWQDARGAWEKVHEETRELAALWPAEGVPDADDPALRARLEHELGDLLLAGATLGSYLEIDPERALREALRRYEARFRGMEEELDGSLAGHGLETLLEAWGRAKARLEDETSA